jgi:hypothetical protein
VPNLRTLVLTQNFVAELADLDPLAECTKLVHVSLVDNPVASKEVRISRGVEETAKSLLREIAELPLLPHLALFQHPLP